ncbi:MAG: DUF1698 domain-containing protein [Leptospiraceae bacterium]|nr:DUF1698 domain-containing protein [Leptospiraceae bacterium]
MQEEEFQQALAFARSLPPSVLVSGPIVSLGPYARGVLPHSGFMAGKRHSSEGMAGDMGRSEGEVEPQGRSGFPNGGGPSEGNGPPAGAGQSERPKAFPGLSPTQDEELRYWLDRLGPFRKGPFSVYGQSVASHWNSDAKWQHCLPFLIQDSAVLQGDVLDLGCNNGYYLFRLLEIKTAGRILGMDPAASFYRQFRFLQEMLSPDSPAAAIDFLPAGHEALADKAGQMASEHSAQHSAQHSGSAYDPEMDLMRTPDGLQKDLPWMTFDAILCWGVIYHRTDPIQLLRTIHGALNSGGVLYLESMGIPEDPGHPYAQSIIPMGKYAGARGIWQVPNARALENYLHRSGFRNIEVLKEWDYSEELNGDTGLPVLQEYLDPNRPGFLQDGLPSPIRILMRARR